MFISPSGWRKMRAIDSPPVNRAKPKLLKQVRLHLRKNRYSRKTEEVYVEWILKNDNDLYTRTEKYKWGTKSA